MATRPHDDSLRLGIDLDGVVADFNAGWVRLHNDEFGNDLHPEMVQTWDGLAELGGFADMVAFWKWAKGSELRPSIFRHLDPFPGAIETLGALAHAGHRIVIITAKPRWAVTDTFRWLADHDVPTQEVHITEEKYTVDCDVYLDDSPHVLPALLRHRGDRHVCRFVRPWNDPLTGATDIRSWDEFHATVDSCSHALRA